MTINAYTGSGWTNLILGYAATV